MHFRQSHWKKLVRGAIIHFIMSMVSIYTNYFTSFRFNLVYHDRVLFIYGLIIGFSIESCFTKCI